MEEKRCAGVLDSEQGFDGGIAAADDDRQVISVVFSELAGEFDAGDIGEMDVEERGIGAVMLEIVEGGLPGLENQGIEPFVSQQGEQGSCDGLVVVDDEDAGGRRFRREHEADYTYQRSTSGTGIIFVHFGVKNLEILLHICV